MLKGIDVTLYEKTQTGTDEADAPVYAETPVTVHNVLVGEPSRWPSPRATPTTGTTCRWSSLASASEPAVALCRASNA